MTDPTAPHVIVSLPGRTLEAVRAQVGTARERGADAAEVRIDRLPPAERTALDRLFPSSLPLVATFRSRTEGGEGDDEAARRASILLAAASHPFRWIDLELKRDLPLLDRLPAQDRLGRIVSYHVGSGGPESWASAVRELEGVAGVGKLVVRATVGDAVQHLVPLAERLGREVVIHSTGPSGPLLRAWARRFRFPLTFAALPEDPATAPVETSQIPVDRLRPFLDGEGTGPLFAVCGRPVAHSRSPAIHSRWMGEAHQTGLYVALEFQDDREFVDALGPLANGGFLGLNVTHPFKTVAAEAATELGPGARACGAANCLTLRDGAITAENTDLLAILRRLEELRRDGSWDGAGVAVLGAGGAARASLAAARELGTRATVYARRPEAAAEVAGAFGAMAGDAGSPQPASLLIHATDVGRAPGTTLQPELPPLLAPGAHVLDWVYAPESPAVRRAAEAAGATYEDGWRLLVYQAAASYEIWWEQPPSPSSVRELVTEGSCAA